MSIDQLFNKALNKGLSDFRNDYGYDKNCNKYGERLGNAEKRLRNTLIKTNDAPCYGDPLIVDAYLSTYHLQHCRLAYWVFKYFFNQFDVPNSLYVCDVGAGTQAGCVGLALALSEYKEKPAVYFDAYEPSDKMWYAGYYFWSAFRDSVGGNFDPDPCSTLPHRLPDNLPDNALRVVTALHLSLPYDRNENNKEEKAQHSLEKAQHSLEKAFRLVSPNTVFSHAIKIRRILCVKLLIILTFGKRKRGLNRVFPIRLNLTCPTCRQMQIAFFCRQIAPRCRQIASCC